MSGGADGMTNTTDQDLQATLRAALKSGAPFGVDGPVKTVETHIAVVFLVGDRAYKMKKALSLGYLDFSGRDNRRALLEKELRLNSRTAPDLYRRVVPVTRTPDGRILVDGDGEAVGWLLEMRRFDQSDLLARRIEPDPGPEQPSESLAVPLAEAIAALHLQEGPCRTEGWHDAVARVLDNMTGHVRNGAEGVLDREAVAQFTEQAFERLGALSHRFEQRAEAGFVRLCHGDLHLSNIVVQDGLPVLFDCIEFNDDIACQDTLYDVAFLLMDLMFRGRRDFGNRVFNAYLSALPSTDRSAALGMLEALPFYGALRALIRCHVCLAQLPADLASEHDEDAATMARARGYLALALNLLSVRQVCLVAVGGLSGSGKSTLARDIGGAFEGLLGALILRTDEIRKRLHGTPLDQALPETAYAPETSIAVYQTLEKEAAMAIGQGMPVIVDGVFARPEQRAAIRALADRLGVPFMGFWLSAEPQVLAARVRERRGDVSDATEEILNRQLHFELGEIDWIQLDSGQGRATVAAQAQAWLNQGDGRAAKQ